MNYLRKLFAIWAGKTAIILSKLLGKKGSSGPGNIALKIYPNLLKDLSSKVKKEIIIVCGTNGKTTTNNMLYNLLTSSGYSVVCNRVGANMLDGIVTAFVDAASLLGNLNADYGCIEADEASAVKIFDHLTPQKIVITNLFRDQLDRYGEIDITIKLLNQALEKVPDATLVLNGDDPLTARFGYNNHRQCYYFGIDQNSEINLNETKEGRFCTFCGQELKYNYYHYSQLGDFFCPSCGFKRPVLDFKAFDVHLQDGLQFEVAYDCTTASFNLNYKGFYNIYNILASMCVAALLGIKVQEINNIFSQYKPQIGRMESFYLGKPVIFNLSKNPAGFNQAISTVLQDPRKKDIMVIINDNAQDGKDISWIWDVDFERLVVPSIQSYIASGIRKEDVAVRFKYAGIQKGDVTVADDIRSAIIDLINRSGEVCYILVNYTALFNTQNILKSLEKTKEY
ncbi:MurT ligase domain-containing protein [Petroclostridium sp. X23]|uniref:Mur ligase family protein n=1 Tax=Petroclostridium sp. X23 TaxID=3045146 RepID=UPI0024AE3E25|nr:MurT ligase domain-containing protein [Petroclostridium sp. X23]WHH57050.1 MurT ligase domain-containing protein [Petroclostridium sp. X23]